ncbi:hypothetical protein AMATHDRAFT_75710 [Amanita thiersii Skay4041]|uniref:Glutamyl-tRNA(Gln) amidotransferase subunit A, mitochondrial n=1 Tax=Amanita thiersii Skay4041 TaxID=703135 RepID=A0A2A9NJQ7_9AGAR|nr:hypothetical protein AMATHDRAFT_75710 [Amanita thiersii Skay4041]
MLKRPNPDWRRAIAEKNATINAFVYTKPPQANPNSEIRKSVSLNGPTDDAPLWGRGIAIKDNICTADMPTTCSSKMLRDFTSPFDATVVKLLREAGADILGKTNCDEFGMGSLNINSVHGPVINPLSVGAGADAGAEPRSAGGSSGGSAAAVAAGMCFGSLGTDTGGSIRLPASYCGVVGLKPSYGLLSRWGVVSFADSLDCVGVLAKNVQDAKAIFDVLNVYDDKDPTAVSDEIRKRADERTRERMSVWNRGSESLQGLRIGVPQEYFPSDMAPFILERVGHVISGLQALGAEVVPVSMPSTSYALSAYYVIASAEASSNMARYDGVEYGMQVRPPPGADMTKTARVYSHTRSGGFGREVQKRILLGTYALTADAYDNYFLQAQKVRQLVKDDFDKVFVVADQRGGRQSGEKDGGVDVLIHASAIRTAPNMRGDGGDVGLTTYVQDVLTVPASLAGVPAINAYGGIGDDGFPVGVSVVGQWGSEASVLRVCEIIASIV